MSGGAGGILLRLVEFFTEEENFWEKFANRTSVPKCQMVSHSTLNFLLSLFAPGVTAQWYSLILRHIMDFAPKLLYKANFFKKPLNTCLSSLFLARILTLPAFYVLFKPDIHPI